MSRLSKLRLKKTRGVSQRILRQVYKSDPTKKPEPFQDNGTFNYCS